MQKTKKRGKIVSAELVRKHNSLKAAPDGGNTYHTANMLEKLTSVEVFPQFLVEFAKTF